MTSLASGENTQVEPEDAREIEIPCLTQEDKSHTPQEEMLCSPPLDASGAANFSDQGWLQKIQGSMLHPPSIYTATLPDLPDQTHMCPTLPTPNKLPQHRMHTTLMEVSEGEGAEEEDDQEGSLGLVSEGEGEEKEHMSLL